MSRTLSRGRQGDPSVEEASTGNRPKRPFDKLEWVGRALVGHPDPHSVSLGASTPPGFRTLETFTAVPSASRPYLLIPMGSRQLAAEAIYQLTNAPTKSVRLAKSLLALGMRAGIAQHLLRDRLDLSMDADASMDGLVVREYLREVFGTRVGAAVLLGADRPNRKPVLQVLTTDGQVLGYAKVGWNAVSRNLVRTEARVLETLAEPRNRPSTFKVPRLLHVGRCGNLEVIVVAPVPREPWYRRGAPVSLPVAATREVSARSLVEHTALVETRYWSALRDRVARPLDHGAATGIREALTEVMDLVADRMGGTVLATGSWHGDWTPWNMSLAGGELYIWDWERSGEDTPLGIDVAHFVFLVLVKIRKLSPQAAVRRSIELCRDLFPKIGVPAAHVRVVTSLHLLEMCTRYEEARASGMELLDPIYLSALRSSVQDLA